MTWVEGNAHLTLLTPTIPKLKQPLIQVWIVSWAMGSPLISDKGLGKLPCTSVESACVIGLGMVNESDLKHKCHAQKKERA